MRLELVLDWAAPGFRSGPNAAAWKGSSKSMLPALSKAKRVQHHPALPVPTSRRRISF
jgi:hypothetical protein